MKTVLELQNIVQAYGDFVAVKNVSFSVKEGEIATLLGPSGCGKTSILRTIAGFENVRAGAILRDGEIISDSTGQVLPEDRRIGMVFQDYALFPHLTVEKNIAFGLKDMPRAERNHRVREMLCLVGLPGVEKKYPHELSGGQQQRVALARALAPKPSFLLMDEPFSNLDVSLREELSREVKKILKSQNTTALMVTHNQAEAFAIADVVGVMQKGELQQWGSPYELYHHPANGFVATFIGEGTLLSGTVDGNVAHTPFGSVPANESVNGDAVQVLVRPEHIVVGGEDGVDATVIEANFRGADTSCVLQLGDGSRISAYADGKLRCQPGERVTVGLKDRNVPVFKQ